MRIVDILIVLLWLIQVAESSKSISIIFGGDVTFASVLKYTVEHGHCTYNESLGAIKKYFQSDHVVVNHEMVYQRPDDFIPPTINSKTHMIADASSIEALKYAGIDYVTLANNHMLDLDEAGVNFTTQLLNKNGIKYGGITYGKTISRQEPLILEENGIKVGILSYCALDACLKSRKGVNAGPAIYDDDIVISEIKELRKRGCHAVILFMHWDTEYTSVMDILTIKNIKHILHHSHVDLIVGAHPHTTHDHFYINNTLISSSLGNLLFHSHYAGSLNFNKADHNFTDSMLKTYEKCWAKMSRLLKNPSQYGRLLKVTFNRRGIVPEKTMYLPTHVQPTQKRDCLRVDKMEKKKWRVVCGDGDPECLGTRECNIMECDGYETFPEIDIPT